LFVLHAVWDYRFLHGIEIRERLGLGVNTEVLGYGVMSLSYLFWCIEFAMGLLGWCVLKTGLLLTILFRFLAAV